MTKKYSEGYPEEAKAEEGFVGFYSGFLLFVLEDPEADGTRASKGIYGWQGVANTHFWIDPEKNLFGLFMTRARDFSWDVGKRYRKAVYSSVK
jgi:CubicO group peptidase (beta-lactamase class C family)